ncbi:MAG: DUF1501 domain-containing protein [Pseudomonadota bacterium]
MKTTRRHFLGASALSLASRTALGWSLAQIGQASAQAATSSDGDYKAIICLYMGGGNDYANTLVPYDEPSYNSYRTYRTDLAYQKNQLLIGPESSGVAIPSAYPNVPMQPLSRLVLNPRDSQNVSRPAMERDGTTPRQYALAPPLSSLAPFFNSDDASERRLAVLLNVGPLLQPDSPTYAQFRSGLSSTLPTSLFAHDYQTSYWLTSHGVDSAATGWGGRAVDGLQVLNEQATFTTISLTGNSAFLTGNNVVQYQVGNGGPDRFGLLRGGLWGSSAAADALAQIVTATGSGLFEDTHTAVMRRAIDAGDVLSIGLDAALTPEAAAVDAILRSRDAQGNLKYPALNQLGPNGGTLGKQLAMAAKIIAARRVTGARRQVFFVSLGGFDSHSDMVRTHPVLLQQVAQGMSEFYEVTRDMGCAEKVTLFTASDFGRTLKSNGDGTDHGWGSMHFVLGGAVKGGQFYGQAPKVGVDTPDDYGSGRLVPTMAVDQLAATLAMWMGVPEQDLPSVAPHIENFRSSSLGINLGFL